MSAGDKHEQNLVRLSTKLGHKSVPTAATGSQIEKSVECYLHLKVGDLHSTGQAHCCTQASKAVTKPQPVCLWNSTGSGNFPSISVEVAFDWVERLDWQLLITSRSNFTKPSE